MAESERSGFPDPLHVPPFHIESCLVQPAVNRIECDLEIHQIEPRVMRVLVCLASRPNEVVSREMLFETVWADSVVCEEVLTRAVSELRRVFRDDTKAPRVIETIRKTGYRLIAQVTPAPGPLQPSLPAQSSLPQEPDPPTQPSLPLEPDPPAPTGRRSVPNPSRQDGRPRPWARAGLGRNRSVAVLSLLGLALIVLSASGVRRFALPGHRGPEELVPRPLTSYPGMELYPALSPDGSMIAFSWAGQNAGGDGPLDIYVMKVSNGSPVRLTSLPGSEGSPTWSPDGTDIAFFSETTNEHEICMVPVLGGPVRRLAAMEFPILGLDWSPDGRTIAYATDAGPGTPIKICLLSVKDLSTRDLTSPPANCRGDLQPSFSPDGRSLAFIRGNEFQERDACFVPVHGGEPRKLDLGGKRVSGVAWLSREELIVAAATGLDCGFWKAPLDSGRPTRLAVPGGRMQRVSKARTGPHLAYEKITYVRDIRGVDLPRAGRPSPRKAPLIASTQRDSEPVFSPDGRSIAFVSDRSGSPEIWIADADGGNPRRLTDESATQLTHPRWSPDGKQIAFTCNADGPSSIHVVDLQSQVARRLLPGGPQILACWSRSRGDLYYQVDAAGGWEVWRVRSDGSGRRQISQAGTTVIDETSDGRNLVVLKSGEPGLWLLPVDGGEKSLLVSGDLCSGWQEAVVAEGGLYYMTRGAETSTVGFYDFAAARCDSLASIEWYAASLAISPDRTVMLYDCIGNLEDDLMLAEVPD